MMTTGDSFWQVPVVTHSMTFPWNITTLVPWFYHENPAFQSDLRSIHLIILQCWFRFASTTSSLFAYHKPVRESLELCEPQPIAISWPRGPHFVSIPIFLRYFFVGSTVFMGKSIMESISGPKNDQLHPLVMTNHRKTYRKTYRKMEVYPLVMTDVAIEHGHRQFVDFPIKSMVIFHSYVSSPVVVSTPLKKYDFVSWDDYSQYMEKQNLFQTTNQI